jgi:hypothetical protein
MKQYLTLFVEGFSMGLKEFLRENSYKEESYLIKCRDKHTCFRIFLKLILLIGALALVLWLYAAWVGMERTTPAPTQFHVRGAHVH